MTLLILVLCYFIYLLRHIWSGFFHILWIGTIPFLVSGFISYLLHPFIRILNNLGIKHWIAFTVVYTLFFGAIVLAVYLGVPAFYDQMKEFSKQAPTLTEKYHDLIFHFESQTRRLPFGIHKKMHQIINHYENSMSHQADGIGRKFTQLPSLILTITTIPFITYYMLHDHVKIKDFFIGIIPRKWQSSVRALFLELDFSLGGYIRGQLFVCLLIGVFSYIAYLMIDMKYPLLLSVIVGVTNIIPTFGPVFGAVPALLIAFTISKSLLLKVFITNAILQIIEGNLISPIIMGKNLRLHPLFIMFALIIGEEVGGISGIIFSVPILAIFKVIFTHVKFHLQQKKESQVRE